MSDSIENNGPWQTSGRRLSGEGLPDGSFKALYGGPAKRNRRGEGFTALFVSKEKARDLAARQARSASDSQAPELDPEAIEKIRKAAFDEAFSEGRQAGLEEGRRQSREIVGRMTDILSRTEGAWQELVTAHEIKIIELVTRAVEKVVYGQAATDQEMVKRTILEAFRLIPEPVNVELSVSPKDYEYIETVKTDFSARIQALKDVSVIQDPAVHQGGCHVRTKFGEVNATLESRMDAIRECLLKVNGRKEIR